MIPWTSDGNGRPKGRSHSDERPAKPWNSAVSNDEGDRNGPSLDLDSLIYYTKKDQTLFMHLIFHFVLIARILLSLGFYTVKSSKTRM